MLMHNGEIFSMVENLADVAALKPGFCAVPIGVMAQIQRGERGAATPGEPDRAAAIAAYNAKMDELTKAGETRPERTIAVKHPAIQDAYLAAINAAG